MAKLAGFGFSAGDQVLLKKGEVWRETWYVNTGGSSGNPITYGSYGAAVAKPRITGTELVSGWTQYSGNIYQASFTNSIDIYLLVEDQTTMAMPVGSLAAVTGAGKFWFDDTNNLVYYWASDGADPDTHTMEIGARYDVVSSDDREYITFDGLQIDGAGGQYGRGFGLKPTWFTPDNITLQNMKISFNYYAGILVSYATNFTPISNFKIYSSEINNNGVFGIWIRSQSTSYRITGFRLDGSNVHHNGLDKTSVGQFGILLESASAPIITGNTIHDNQGQFDWSGNLYLSYSINATVEYNTVYNGYKNNIHFDGASNGFVAKYNVSYGAFWNGFWVEEHLRANGTSQIINNTSYGNLHGFVFGPGVSPTTVSGVTVKNNIFAYNTRASDDLNNTASDNDVDYNIYYTDGSAEGQFRYNNGFVDFATWKTNTGWDANSTFSEPVFLNRTSQDFHLTSSSPAINAGTSLSLTPDFAGTAVPQGSAPDDGAYEFILPSAPSSLAQYKSDGTTSITTGDWSGSSVVLKFNMSSSNSTDSLSPQVEVREVGTDFTNSVTNSGDAVAYSGSAVTGTVTITGLTTGTTYHWQARISNSAGQGSWVSYGGNVESATDFKADATAPTSGSVVINSGATNTNSRSVTLTISATDSNSGNYQMMVSENSDFSGASWETYSTSKSWTLSTTDGTKTVYTKFKDNTENTSSAVSDSIVLDTTAPADFSLDSPGDNSYTKDERPTFKWKAATDATTGLSKYVLEIDNPSIGSSQPSGDFTIDNIPTSGTTDITSNNKYVIHFDGFSDSDSTNNYISVYTRSTSDWGTSENDGKLREGRVSWKVKTVDNAGNETSSSRTLFVDKTSPSVTFTQINSTLYTSNNFSTTDKTPTIFGKITDSLSGGDSSQTQDENGPKVASAPKEVNIKVEKKEGLTYKLVTLYKINMDNPYYTCDPDKTIDNSKQKCDKYLPFEYTPKENLGLGTYRITLSGKDKSDNTSSESSFTLNIATLAQITTPEEKNIIEEGIKELPKEDQKKVKEELEITKPSPSLTLAPSQGIGGFFKNILGGIINTTGNIFSYLAGVTNYGGQTIGQGLKQPKHFIVSLGDWLSYTTTSFGEIVLDQEPTKITDVKVAKLNKDSVIITWKTNHLATSKVNYGETLDYGKDIQSSTKVHDHKMEITGLKPTQKYYYEVMSQNKNYVYDAHHEFITPKE